MTPSPNAMLRDVIVPELCEESADICKGAVPRAGSKVSAALGAAAVAADTVTVFVVVEVNPALSVKVNFTRNVPAEVYECVAATAFDAKPSPKEMDRETMFPDPARNWQRNQPILVTVQYRTAVSPTARRLAMLRV